MLRALIRIATQAHNWQQCDSSAANAGVTTARRPAAIEASTAAACSETEAYKTPLQLCAAHDEPATMVKKKAKSHRQTLKQKYKVQKRVKEHDRKLKKAQKRGGLPPGKKKRDPGIPNSWPIKQELLEQVERAKAKKEQDREAAKQAKKERRKLAKQGLSMEQLAASAKERGAAFDDTSDAPVRQEDALDEAAKRSAKAYARELAKVVEASDVVLEVLDARDPAGSRSSRVESAVRRAPGKRLVLVLNKVDLVPREIATQWLDVLRSTGLAVVAFKASTKGGVAQSALDSAKDAAVVDERERAGEGVVRGGLAAVPVEERGVRTNHRVAAQDEARQDHGRA